MFKEIMVGGVVLFLLIGCDSAENANKSDPSSQGQQTETVESETVIYLAGGAAIDFRRRPVNDRVVEDGVSKIRVVQYVFDESYEAVDKSVASVLLAEKYLRREVAGDFQLSAVYAKPGYQSVLMKYKVGTAKKTTLTISWRF